MKTAKFISYEDRAAQFVKMWLILYNVELLSITNIKLVV